MRILNIGTGYLGSHLAFDLKKKHQVTVTTRKKERLEQIKNWGTHAIYLNLSDEHHLSEVLDSHDVIILTLAPSTQDSYESTYLFAATQLFKALDKKPTKHIIYTSSTSVYGEQNGALTTELSPLNYSTDSSRILHLTEKQLLSCSDFGHIISVLRVAEIYGPTREFVTKIRNRFGFEYAGDGSQFVNAIHLEDIIKVIGFIIEQTLQGIFNLACDDHPSRKEFYRSICHKYNLPEIHWNPSLNSPYSGNKKVSSAKIQSLGYKFLHPYVEY